MSTQKILNQPTIDVMHADELSQKTLLCIDDNVADIMLVQQIIGRRRDFRVMSATNGNIGLQIARQYLPDAILMDIRHPGINGIDLIKKLRDDVLTAHIPVIAISANAFVRDIENGMNAGFFRYITKPFKLEHLMETIEVSLQYRKSRLG